MGSTEGFKKRPTTERDRLYHLVLDLSKEGLSYNQIIERVKVETGVTIRKSNVSGWINGKHKPFGYVRYFDAAPTVDLAYVVGVYLGDGSSSTGRRNYNHMVKLRVIDREFAEEFARCLGVLLHRAPPRVKWHEKTRSWHTQVSSLLLQNFLRQELNALVPAVTHCDDCKPAFLRGFFDSEGSMSGRSLMAANEYLELLKIVCELLDSLGIQTTGIHLATKGGRTVTIKGKFYRQNEDLFYLRVRSTSLQRFEEVVGFVIQRKSDALSGAVDVKP